MESRKKKSDYIVQAVDHALDVLEAFTTENEELGVTEIAQRLGLHKNNVFRLLATLQCRGYIEQDTKTENYRLGIKTFEVASVFLHHLRLRTRGQPILEGLVARCDETGYLAVRDGLDIIYVLMQETSQTVRILPRLGRRLPAYCTAAGKVQLAFESSENLRQILDQMTLTRLTENTITDHEALREHLAEVARRGYAVDDEECEYGVRCVAAPVRDYSHRVIASLGLAGPVLRMTPERVDGELASLVTEAALRLSQHLGFEVGVTAVA